MNIQEEVAKSPSYPHSIINKAKTGRLIIPDLWHLAMWLKDNGHPESSAEVLECWHIAHHLKKHVEQEQTT